MPNRFRKRPPEVEAVLWSGENIAEIRELIGPERGGDLHQEASSLRVWHSDRVVWVHRGQWLVRSSKREFWAMDGDKFRARYEALPASEE